MSETAEGLALAENAARLDAKANLHADRRGPKTADGQLQGVRDLRACRDHDKIVITVGWDAETAKRAADLSATMSRESEPPLGFQPKQQRGVDRSVFDRLMQ